MSEHVLCMVLYLIELGLDNQVQEDKVEEVSVFSVIWAIIGDIICGISKWPQYHYRSYS